MRDWIKINLVNFQCIFSFVDLTLIETIFKKCNIYMNNLMINDFSQQKITSFCNHKINVCLICVFFLIASQFASKVWNHIECSNCNKHLNYDDVKLFTNHNIFEKLINFDLIMIFQIDHNYKYDDLYHKKSVFSEHFQACWGSNCKFRQQRFFDQNNYMICNDYKTCCVIIEIQCAKVKALKKTKKTVTTKYLNKNSKLCPKCNVRGVKKWRCDYMICMRYYVLFVKKCEHIDNKKTSVVNTNTAESVLPAIKKSNNKTIICTKQFANIAL